MQTGSRVAGPAAVAHVLLPLCSGGAPHLRPRCWRVEDLIHKPPFGSSCVPNKGALWAAEERVISKKHKAQVKAAVAARGPCEPSWPLSAVTNCGKHQSAPLPLGMVGPACRCCRCTAGCSHHSEQPYSHGDRRHGRRISEEQGPPEARYQPSARGRKYCSEKLRCKSLSAMYATEGAYADVG